MRIIKVYLLACLCMVLLAPALWCEQPYLIFYDPEGIPTPKVQNNTTVFDITPGSQITVEIVGAPFSPFALYMSLFTTPFPLELEPPALFLMPPLLPIVTGPDKLLDASGSYSFGAFIPLEFYVLGQEIDLYFQGFVQDPSDGFQLTNGVRMHIMYPRYKADLAVGRGTTLKEFQLIGRVIDEDAADGVIEPIVQDPDIPAHIYAFKDDSNPGTDEPEPSNSIYLNGIFPLVPGDAGINDHDFFATDLISNYPKIGSHMHIYARDRICRNNENRNLQHLIVPIYEEGEKAHDLNVYHFRDKTADESGFFVVDVKNNDMYLLKGTMKANDAKSRSPWDPNVAVSPDGLYMAAVKKSREGDDVTNWNDSLHIIKLRKDDVWSDGNHARRAKVNDPSDQTQWKSWRATYMLAETLTFAGDPHPHALFFACNRFNTQGANPEPPPEIPSILWYINAANEGKKAKFYKHAELPMVANNFYQPIYFGSPQDGNSDILNELKWLRSDNHRTICFRMAGRYVDDPTNPSNYGEWSWDVFSLTNIRIENNAVKFDLQNITDFPEYETEEGFIVFPFGHAYNGTAKGAISPNGLFVAITTIDDDVSDDTEDLFLVPTDGSVAGSLQPHTGPYLFKGKFLEIRVIFDPFFADNDTLFFCAGRHLGWPLQPEMDLFLLETGSGNMRNLTNTAGEQIPDPPEFREFGNIRPAGFFTSPDDHYLFFFRGFAGGGGLPKYLNLVGVDRYDDFKLFDLTGSEFSNGFIPPTDNHMEASFKTWGPESMNVVLIPTEDADLILFNAKYALQPESMAHQVFMVNLDYPLAAFPLTTFHPVDEPGLVDNLVADSTGTYVAFSRSNVVFLNPSSPTYGKEGAYEQVYVVDLSSGAYMRNLTPNNNFTNAAIDGSFRFIRSAPGTPGMFIFGMGFGGSNDKADNPKSARIHLYPLDTVSDPLVPPVYYPLTQQKTMLLFNALPY